MHIQVCVLCDYWLTEASLGSACKDTGTHGTIAPLILGHIRGHSGAMFKFSSVKDYIQYTNMDKLGTWGTEIELLVLSHLLNTSIYTYLTTDKKWVVYSPSKLDKKN